MKTDKELELVKEYGAYCAELAYIGAEASKQPSYDRWLISIISDGSDSLPISEELKQEAKVIYNRYLRRNFKI